jgi:hypothetical protein
MRFVFAGSIFKQAAGVAVLNAALH